MRSFEMIEYRWPDKNKPRIQALFQADLQKIEDIVEEPAAYAHTPPFFFHYELFHVYEGGRLYEPSILWGPATGPSLNDRVFQITIVVE